MTVMVSYLLPILVAFITAIMGPIAIEWTKHKISLRKKTKQTPIKEALVLNESIDTQLSHIMEELSCDQVWIIQFHNGGHFYPTGKSIQKFSIFYEKVTPETPSIQYTFQNIPVSLFPKSLSKVYDDNELEVSDFTSDDLKYDLGTFAESYHSKSISMTGLQALDGQLIGVLCISYSSEAHKLNEYERNYVRNKAGAIGMLLTNYLSADMKGKGKL